MITVLLFTALSMGFLGSLHCAGMCGPIMLILPFQQLSGWKKVAGITVYHFGRITVYALMGLLLHSFKELFHPSWQQYISMGLGVLLLCFGGFSFFMSADKAIRMPWLNFVKKRLAKVMGNPAPEALAIAGVLNGLLPCGLVYMALALAATAPSSMAAMAAMYAFGAGTLPMLVSIILLKQKVPLGILNKVRSFVPIMIFVFGGLFLLRGMNLGIPYLSPQVSIANQVIKSNCCHK